MISPAQLRAARALLGLDQRSLAALAGVSLPTVQRMEASSGDVRGAISTLTKVVEALDAAGVELIANDQPSQGRGRGVRLKERAIHLTWDGQVEEKLAREGYDVKFGARPLRRMIQRTVEDVLSEELLGGSIALGDMVHLVVEEGRIAVRKPDKAQEEADLPAQEDAPRKPRTRKAKKPDAQEAPAPEAAPAKPRTRRKKTDNEA